jgi:hypothetical protein
MPRRLFLIILVIAGLAGAIGSACAAVRHEVTVSTLPDPVLIEQGRSSQFLNFDFVLENHSKQDLTIFLVEVSVLGDKDEVLFQKRVGPNGRSILIVPNRRIPSGQRLLVFNPHFAFDQDLKLDRLRFRFGFDTDRDRPDASVEVVVRPLHYRPKTDLILPLEGRLFVHDGHDFYSHHRRLDVTFPLFAQLGLKANPTRYANDFCNSDEQGRLYRGEGETNELWFGFGAPVRAPAGGKLVCIVRDMEDNTRQRPFSHDPSFLIRNPSSFSGNHVMIDHGNGEFSLLAHLRKGSVRGTIGDVVKQGQIIGEMGCSGDTAFPHLHHNLQSGPEVGAAGLPAYFRDFKRLNGQERVVVKFGAVDSGDMLINEAGQQKQDGRD